MRLEVLLPRGVLKWELGTLCERVKVLSKPRMLLVFRCVFSELPASRDESTTLFSISIDPARLANLVFLLSLPDSLSSSFKTDNASPSFSANSSCFSEVLDGVSSLIGVVIPVSAPDESPSQSSVDELPRRDELVEDAVDDERDEAGIESTEGVRIFFEFA